MAVPARYDIRLYEGDDATIVLQWRDTDGTPKNIGTSTIKFGAKRSLTDKALLFSVDGQIINAPLGKFAIAIPSAVTTGLTDGKLTMLPYDVEVILPSGLTQTLFYGFVRLQPEVYP